MLTGLIGYGEYIIFIKGREWAKPQHGTVVSSYESSGKYSSECFATVVFDNGDTQHVNTGHTCYSTGDNFVGELEWTPFLGISGTAYSWSPSGLYLVFSLTAMLFNGVVIFGFIAFMYWYAFIHVKDEENGN